MSRYNDVYGDDFDAALIRLWKDDTFERRGQVAEALQSIGWPSTTENTVYWAAKRLGLPRKFFQSRANSFFDQRWDPILDGLRDTGSPV